MNKSLTTKYVILKFMSNKNC